jgi:hypothetical protein
MKNVDISSSKGTPEDQVLFVIEEPSVTRVKMRLVDVEQQIKESEHIITQHTEKLKEAKDIKKEMKKLLVDFNK